MFPFGAAVFDEYKNLKSLTVIDIPYKYSQCLSSMKPIKTLTYLKMEFFHENYIYSSEVCTVLLQEDSQLETLIITGRSIRLSGAIAIGSSPKLKTLIIILEHQQDLLLLLRHLPLIEYLDVTIAQETTRHDVYDVANDGSYSKQLKTFIIQTSGNSSAINFHLLEVLLEHFEYSLEYLAVYCTCDGLIDGQQLLSATRSNLKQLNFFLHFDRNMKPYNLLDYLSTFKEATTPITYYYNTSCQHFFLFNTSMNKARMIAAQINLQHLLIDTEQI
ncbi:unnamed protein product [Didymodactylos carnosus]|uniref:Uncharacterized protein n=1 Tax=Didymodactylos carnosus TaxID=1234261 RepID=A0A815W1N9_9BILA|nr:unnamed protein product [Didymodactylos carnosus]CAF1539273.1 unnamed protein product [Didymodactylos carnosus]CAF4246266.1 unnamed protein product [Didymodactylos carnosus]CAF4399441.1 unnamed protein product [Didymodactylos carnosus]